MPARPAASSSAGTARASPPCGPWPPPDVDPLDARHELARRWLHVSGPSTPAAFATWAGIAPRAGRPVFEALGSGLRPVRTPLGEAWILASDESAFREAASAPASPAPVRILSSGDPYLMAGDRELLVPDADRRRELYPPGTVWPGGLMVAGELVGTWRRAAARMTVRSWRRLSRSEREAVEAEAATLPISGLQGEIHVAWEADKPADGRSRSTGQRTPRTRDQRHVCGPAPGRDCGYGGCRRGRPAPARFLFVAAQACRARARGLHLRRRCCHAEAHDLCRLHLALERQVLALETRIEAGRLRSGARHEDLAGVRR